MPTPADTLKLRTAQRGIRALVERDLTAFWRTLDLAKPEAARAGLLRFVPALVDTYGTIAADVAADWYDEVRASDQVAGRYRATALMPDETDAVQGTVQRLAGGLWSDAPEDVLASLLGRAAKYALDGSRITVSASALDDPWSSGWQRITRPDACKFCTMLAGRGGVYKEATATFASHDDCNCAAAPSWDPDAPEVDVKAYEASQRTSRMSDVQRAEHNARARDWIASYL